jgi:hypothetical protein
MISKPRRIGIKSEEPLPAKPMGENTTYNPATQDIKVSGAGYGISPRSEINNGLPGSQRTLYARSPLTDNQHDQHLNGK